MKATCEIDTHYLPPTTKHIAKDTTRVYPPLLHPFPFRGAHSDYLTPLHQHMLADLHLKAAKESRVHRAGIASPGQKVVQRKAENVLHCSLAFQHFSAVSTQQVISVYIYILQYIFCKDQNRSITMGFTPSSYLLAPCTWGMRQ
jgi:hypothetical protein